MLGAILGDIVGSRWEFHLTNDYHFEWLSGKNGFTDDTICTVAVADALLRGRDFGENIHEWCRRYPCPMGGYGGRFSQWVNSNNPRPYGSFGNGAAMRVSPVAWRYDDVDTVLEAAKQTAACTHNHPEGIKGAQTVALSIYQARELKKAAGAHFGSTELKALLDYAQSFSGYSFEIQLKEVQNRFDETCHGTVPVALWIVYNSNSFEDAIRKAVSLGADADTLGAIVGSIAEAIWGIPLNMQFDALGYLPSEMKTVVLEFYRRFVPNNPLTVTSGS